MTELEVSRFASVAKVTELDAEKKEIDTTRTVQVDGETLEDTQIYKVVQEGGDIWETNIPELERRIASLTAKAEAVVIPEEPEEGVEGYDDLLNAYNSAVSQKERYEASAVSFQALLDDINKL